MHNLQIIPIPAFEDNYIWLIHDGKQAIVVDPGDEVPVLSTLQRLNLTLHTILITHHHLDHIGGVLALLAHYAQTKVYAPALEQYAFQHTPMSEENHITIDALNLSFKILDLPGHTLGHIAYYAELADGNRWLFSGDVIFAAGCGFVPEGQYAQAYQSLQKIAALPANTQVFCTHEYTLQNIRFALTLEPNNLALSEKYETTQKLRTNKLPSLPTTIASELATNPYLRCSSAEIVTSLNENHNSNITIFTLIRKLKNNYKSYI